MEERKLTNSDHLDLWEVEFKKWANQQPNSRAKTDALVIIWFLVTLIGFAVIITGLTLAPSLLK
jgi:hypothetical protein